MTDELPPQTLGRLVQALALLALPPDAQVAYLEAIGVGGLNDELALEFHEGALLLPQMVSAGWIFVDDGKALQAIDSILDDMSGHKEEWEPAALASSPAWAAVRARAREVLFALWVRGSSRGGIPG